jgi:hypothetical protein
LEARYAQDSGDTRCAQLALGGECELCASALMCAMRFGGNVHIVLNLSFT